MHSTFTLDWPTTTQHLKWASGTTRRSFQTYPIFWPPQVDSSPLAQILVRTISFSFWVFIWTQMIPKLDIQNILTFSLDSRKQRTQPVTTSPKQKPFDQTRFTTLEKKWETRLEPTTYKKILTSTRLEPTYKKFLPWRGSNHTYILQISLKYHLKLIQHISC